MDNHIQEGVLEERLASLEAAHKWNPRVVSRLETLIRTGDDFDLFRINPLAYSADTGIDEGESIDLFLHAANVGLFDMDWLIVCGSCANVFSSFRRLEALDPHFTCNVCSMENEADLDDYIQVAFTISPQVRGIAFHDPALLTAEDLYFRYHFSDDVKPLPNGMTVPDTLRSWTKLIGYLDPDETRRVEVDISSGVLAIIDVIGSTSAMFLIPPGSEEQDTKLSLDIADGQIEVEGGMLAPFKAKLPEGTSYYDDEGAADLAESGRRPPDRERNAEGDSSARSFRFSWPAIGQLSPGHAAVSVHNRGASRTSVWIVAYPALPEEVGLIEFGPMLSAKRLLSTQTFRQLFRSETAPASESLQIRDLTYLFTDLTDSTAMYDDIGDANAYNLVRLHFDMLVSIIARHSGAVVKTIGDAIMATFVNPDDAVRAAVATQSALKEFNETNSSKLIIEIGIHRGHSIAVTLNDQIDYFGQSVNIAARVQQLARPGELVLTGDVYETPGVATLLTSFDVAETTEIVKGVGETLPVYAVQTVTTD